MRIHRQVKSEDVMRNAQRGFTLVELLIATIVLLVGIIAVMQLVPAAMQSNLRNRHDTTAVVTAQRLLDQMISQPLDNPQFTDADGQICQMGSPATPTIPAAHLMVVGGTSVRINFNGPAVVGYSTTYRDPNDPTGTPYEVRWAVITNSAAGVVVSKRFIVGAWRRDPRQTQPPVTVEGWVQR